VGGLDFVDIHLSSDRRAEHVQAFGS